MAPQCFRGLRLPQEARTGRVQLGHGMVDVYPALTPLLGPHPGGASIPGVTVEVDASIQTSKKRKKAASRPGFLFTHRGIALTSFFGPIVVVCFCVPCMEHVHSCARIHSCGVQRMLLLLSTVLLCWCRVARFACWPAILSAFWLCSKLYHILVHVASRKSQPAV
jgi:hypothetical protein